MILVDTSVWIDHFRKKNTTLSALLEAPYVFTHPSVIGELACGNIFERPATLERLYLLPRAIVAGHEEVFRLIEDRRLYGLGIGWIDANLIASALLSDCSLWTIDQALGKAAARAGVTLFVAHRPNGHQ